jgi:hypothetical protein
MQLMRTGFDNSSSWSRGLNQPESKIKGWMVALFLVEDLLVRVQEMKIPNLKHRSKGLRQFLAEASEWAACGK